MEEMVGMKMAPPISLRDFLLEYKQALKNDIKELDDLYDTDVESLDDECAIEKLQQDDDPYVSEYMPGLSERNRVCVDVLAEKAYELQTFRSLNEYKKNVVKNPFQRTRDSFKAPDVIPKNTEAETDVDIANDLLIWVRVYRPARATHIGQSLESPVFAEEFACLGSNLLSELRDKISCICNGKRFFDISENPKQHLIGKDTDPAYFFITDTFYNDMRNPNNADYSETVLTWAKKAPGIKNMKFKVAKMEETRLIDLTISMGFPQQYQHHGNCEHIFTFSQVELLTNHIKLFSRADYPILMSFNFFNNRLCNMCSHCVYSFVIEGSDRQLHEPAYLCENCFMRYHYLDGKKIGTFKAYRIQDFKTDFDDEINNESDNVSETNEKTNHDNNDDVDEMMPSTSKATKKTVSGKKSAAKPKTTKTQGKTKEKAELEKPTKRIYTRKKIELQENAEQETALVKTKRTYKARKPKLLDSNPSTSKKCSNGTVKQSEQRDFEEEVLSEAKNSETKKRQTSKKTPATRKKAVPEQVKIKSEYSKKEQNTKSSISFENSEDQKFIEEPLCGMEAIQQIDKKMHILKVPLKKNSKSEIIEKADDMEFIAENTSTNEAYIENDDDMEFIDATPPKTVNNHNMLHNTPTTINLRRSIRKREERELIEDLLADLTS